MAPVPAGKIDVMSLLAGPGHRLRHAWRTYHDFVI